MSKKFTNIVIVTLLLVLIGYIVFDIALQKKVIPIQSQVTAETGIEDQWMVNKVFDPGKGQLNAVTVSGNDYVVTGGESFAACYDTAFNLIWEYKTDMPVTALTVFNNDLYAAVGGMILVFNLAGEKTMEWGPFENNSMITSLAANDAQVAFADAANKAVYVLDKSGNLKSIIGRSGEPFIIPSYYFDIAFAGKEALYIANTGRNRIEKRDLDGNLLEFFGEPGTSPGAFCGCCNPSHFALLPDGFVTAEKGINRIKILNSGGTFKEFVTSVNNFVPPLPLDVASNDGKTIYGANPADSKLYVFRRK